jgi:hypothetical protein
MPKRSPCCCNSVSRTRRVSDTPRDDGRVPESAPRKRGNYSPHFAVRLLCRRGFVLAGSMIGAVEFLFFPRLIYPRKEHEIHEGRKRIDIAMENTARSGPFADLTVIRNYPAAYVFFECKNYGREVGNPEIDQLSGRFSRERSPSTASGRQPNEAHRKIAVAMNPSAVRTACKPPHFSMRTRVLVPGRAGSLAINVLLVGIITINV